MLLQGSQHRVQGLQEGSDFLVLEPLQVERLRRKKAPIAVAALALAILMVVFADFHISLAMVTAAVIMILTGCLSIEEAHESIDWRTVFLVAGMLPLGMAMEVTGTGQYLANIMLGALGDYGPTALLAGMYLMAAFVTQAMSNAAAMVLIVPIAVDTALGLGADPRLKAALDLVLSKQDPQGRWKHEYTYNGKMWADIEEKGKPSKWVTLRVLCVIKRAFDAGGLA